MNFSLKLIEFLKKYYFKYFKNKYFTTIVVFLFFMLFIDNDNFITQIKRKYQIYKLEKEIVYYNKELVIAKIEERALTENNEYFEKFVREKYLLKKENEDLFIFSEEAEN